MTISSNSRQCGPFRTNITDGPASPNVRQNAPAISEVNADTGPQPAQKYIYIVDDESSVRQGLSYALRTAGYEVRPFASGRDFLDDVLILSPGCVLLDLRMPDLGGLEVLNELGEMKRMFPCIAMTGYGDLKTAVQAIKCGAREFLEKPFTDDAMLAAVEEVFATFQDDLIRNAATIQAEKLVAGLSGREKETLQGLSDGLSNKAVAHKMGLSVRTVEMHRSNLLRGLGVKSVGEAAQIAMAAGLKPF